MTTITLLDNFVSFLSLLYFDNRRWISRGLAPLFHSRDYLARCEQQAGKQVDAHAGQSRVHKDPAGELTEVVVREIVGHEKEGEGAEPDTELVEEFKVELAGGIVGAELESLSEGESRKD